MTLGDVPGGPEFVAILIQAIKDLSLLYAGTPDDAARPHLQVYLDSIRPAVIYAVGAGTAATLLDVFHRAMLNRSIRLKPRAGRDRDASQGLALRPVKEQ